MVLIQKNIIRNVKEEQRIVNQNLIPPSDSRGDLVKKLVIIAVSFAVGLVSGIASSKK